VTERPQTSAFDVSVLSEEIINYTRRGLVFIERAEVSKDGSLGKITAYIPRGAKLIADMPLDDMELIITKQTYEEDLSWVETGSRILYEDDGCQMICTVGDVSELIRAVRDKAIRNVRPFPP
jgi:hypothetical protein